MDFFPARRCAYTSLTVIILFIVRLELIAQSPGGVSTNLDFWLKANAGAYVNAGTTLATTGQNILRISTGTLSESHRVVVLP